VFLVVSVAVGYTNTLKRNEFIMLGANDPPYTSRKGNMLVHHDTTGEKSGWPAIARIDYRVANTPYTKWYAGCVVTDVVVGILLATFSAMIAGTVTGVVQSRIKARRCDRGFCVRCGYDLRATPERCPE
jgi:hypothetical protein